MSGINDSLSDNEVILKAELMTMRFYFEQLLKEKFPLEYDIYMKDRCELLEHFVASLKKPD